MAWRSFLSRPRPPGQHRRVVVTGALQGRWSFRSANLLSTKGNRCVVPTGTALLVEDDYGAGRQHVAQPFDDNTAALTSTGQLRSDDGTTSSSRNEAGSSAYRIGRGREATDVVRELQEAEVPPILHDNVMLIIASFELPLKVVRTTKGLSLEKQKSLVMPQLHALQNEIRVPVKFVGWPGIVATSDAEEREIEKLLEPHDCVPVFLTAPALENFIGFAYHCVWPLFHNVLVFASERVRSILPKGWSAYKAINELYAQVILKQAQETDIIWVHDFQLLLVPQYITSWMQTANIGLFLHTPFPSSEIFRCFPMREELLRGMLFADLIGFHFFEYARHFLVACKRLLGLDHHFRMGGFLELDYEGRTVMLRIGHVHIQYDELRHHIDGSEQVAAKASEIRRRFEGRFIFASIDRCERLAGIMLKLRGFRNFLRNYPYARKRAALVQLAYPPTRAWESPKPYADDIRKLAAAINAEFGSPYREGPVLLEIRSVTPEEKYALFASADCLLDTSVRDGLNLNPFEYICCRRELPGPLILSEFTGCCHTLASAMRVNPWRAEDITQALDRAINTPRGELADRFLRDQMYLERNSTLHWAEEFLIDLQRARKKDALLYASWGFGTPIRVLGSEFQHLDQGRVVRAFQTRRGGGGRVIFLDHEGTLAVDRRSITAVPGFESLSARGAAPSRAVRQCLSQLCQAENTTVVILSGRDRSLLTSWFGDIPGLGLCAEHGSYYRIPWISGSTWMCTMTGRETDFTWRPAAMELIRMYVKRTQGAFIENKGSAIVFQYRDADPDFGTWQAKELTTYLEELLARCPVTVVAGKGYVEVKQRGVSKGEAVKTILRALEYMGPTKTVDFVLCIGDDRSDEEMFPVVNALIPSEDASSTTPKMAMREPQQKLTHDGTPGKPISEEESVPMSQLPISLLPTSPECKAYSVTVGRKPSRARFYLNDVDEVLQLVQALATTTA